ncbi:MAG: hypothetical protein FJ253_07865 [Phycisphaerae bacterium]|nr:hypothetical protein [Phycisphaerae bacterium]
MSATAALPVRPRRALSRSLRLWIDTSFTSLSRGAEPGEVERLAIPQAPGSRDDEPAPVVTRREIAGGVILGRLMHRIFEWASNSGPGADLGEIVNAAIADSGDAGRLDAALVRSMTERTRSADLSACGGPRTSLDAIPASASAAELEFCLPMGHATSLSPARLAAALERAPPGSPASLFSPHAAHLGFGEITGFLRGVIDLLFEFDGRWWIVDYKTNDLGERDDDYRAASLTREMIEQRYVLQELLYAVAARRLLRRHGAARSREWLGGVIYPFVRGVDPREPGRGFFVDRPDDALLDALDEMLRAPGAEAAP